MKALLNDSLKYGDFNDLSTAGAVTASAPCRLDMGGTLDIATLFYPLQSYRPVTVNLAINLRTRVRLTAHTSGFVKVSSRGFDAAEFKVGQAPFDHPLGLMFAVVAYFGAHGLHVHIDSPSPPKSGLGGSSAAAVALVAVLARLGVSLGRKALGQRQIAMLAHAIEAAVNMVPCGYQDQLAAVYGGVNAWQWHANAGEFKFKRRIVVKKSHHRRFQKQMLVAYSGIPHVSSDINGQWLRQFLSGHDRNAWVKMIAHTRQFAQALSENDIPTAVAAMNEEVAIRRKLTPKVLGNIGRQLVEAAIRSGCGARFTGAGGGGCIWAVGGSDHIQTLKGRWAKILSGDGQAHMIAHGIDDKGVVVG